MLDTSEIRNVCCINVSTAFRLGLVLVEKEYIIIGGTREEVQKKDREDELPEEKER